MRAVLLAQAAATLFMTGVIWFVQVVHYPLMARVDRSGFQAYETDHARLTAYVVVIPMIVELLLSFYLAIRFPNALSLTGASLVGVIWCSTFLLQVPQHDILREGFQPSAHARLVNTNWIRTIAWSLRALLVLYSLH
jgi:hypothetical protein